MTWRTYQPGSGSRGTILAWYVPGDLLTPGADGWTIRTSPDPRAAAPRDIRGPVVLVGYSAGCQGVRDAICGPVPLPAGVVTIDGTHAPLGGPPPAVATAWRRLAARARAGDALWVASCLASHDYVERGRGAYLSTAHLLERVTDAELAGEPTRKPSGMRNGKVFGPPAECRIRYAVDEGGLHLRSYHSAHTDHNEHAAQLTRVLPGLWSELVVPWLVDTAPDTERSAPSTQRPPARPLGERIADVAREYLGHREAPGPANNPQIGSMLYPCRRGGTAVAGILDASGVRVGLTDDATAWCAAFRSFVLFLAGVWTEDGDRAACPHGYRLSVRELVEDARRLGTWRDIEHAPRGGDAAVFLRAGGDPRRGGHGHVSTVVRVEGDRVWTIGGNEADAVRESEHRIGDPDLVGWITTG